MKEFIFICFTGQLSWKQYVLILIFIVIKVNPGVRDVEPKLSHLILDIRRFRCEYLQSCYTHAW